MALTPLKPLRKVKPLTKDQAKDIIATANDTQEILKETKKLSLATKKFEFELNKLTDIPDGIYHGGKETAKYYSSTQVKGILKKELGRETTGALQFGVNLHADIEAMLLDRTPVAGSEMKGADKKKYDSCLKAFETVQARYMDFTHLEHAMLMDIETIKNAKVPKWMETFRSWIVKHNIPMKIKPDWVKLDEDKKTFKIVDWKSTTSDNLNSIVKDTTNYGYVFSAYFYALPLMCLGYELEGYELVFLVKKYTQMSAVVMNLDLAGKNCTHSMDYYLKLDFTSFEEEIYGPSKKLKPIEFIL